MLALGVIGRIALARPGQWDWARLVGPTKILFRAFAKKSRVEVLEEALRARSGLSEW